MQAVTLNDLASTVSPTERDTAEALFERVFDSLKWIQMSGKTIEQISALTRWAHRQTSEIEADMVYLHIDREKVLTALSDYLATPELQSKQADWLFLNILVYTEYIATVRGIRLKIVGLDRFAKSPNPQMKEHQSDITSLVTRRWHVPIALIGIAISWVVHPIIGVSCTAYMLYRAYHKQKTVRPINTTISSMLQTYLSLNTIDLDWSSVSANLKGSSGAGAKWHSSLYALVERRLSARPA